MALCIGCHSEQPGGYHSQLKESRDYQGFMEKYGKQWRLRKIHALTARRISDERPT